MFGYRVPAPDQAMLISGGQAEGNANVVMEVGRFLVPLREPWIVASSTCRKVLNLLASPRCVRRQRIPHANGRGAQGGSGASAVCGSGSRSSSCTSPDYVESPAPKVSS
jgi:hypothetical protein